MSLNWVFFGLFIRQPTKAVCRRNPGLPHLFVSPQLQRADEIPADYGVG